MGSMVFSGTTSFMQAPVTRSLSNGLTILAKPQNMRNYVWAFLEYKRLSSSWGSLAPIFMKKEFSDETVTSAISDAVKEEDFIGAGLCYLLRSMTPDQRFAFLERIREVEK